MERHVARPSTPDLNLLVALDVLLAEGSVAAAARRLGLSPSATSRALERLRRATGDQLLVRAGRGLVPTPRALELRAQVGAIVDAATAVLRPSTGLVLADLDLCFTLRTSEGFAETFGPRLLEIVAARAPGVTLQFLAKLDKDPAPLRDGTVDIETGVVDPQTAPEFRALSLFEDRWVGVVRSGHPLAVGTVAGSVYGEARHVVVRRRGLHGDDVDEALRPSGYERRAAVVVNGFATALALARDTDLVATVPERHTEGLSQGLHRFDLPVAVPRFTVSMLWHPRMDGDPAHRWLRSLLRSVCAREKRATEAR